MQVTRTVTQRTMSHGVAWLADRLDAASRSLTTRRGLPFAAAFLALLVAGPTTSLASDHIDGIQTALDNAADVTDLYTFTSPRDPDKLVMIMSVHGLAHSRSRFSNAVDYKLRIRPVADARALTPSADPASESSVVCSFSGGFFLVSATQRATCTFRLGAVTESIVFSTRGEGFQAGGAAQKGDLKVFAGVRSDSWFLDLARTLEFNGGLPVDQQSRGINGLHGQNVLSIVVELDKRRLPGPLLAVTAQTVRK
jgi:hypothetical protein